MFAKPFRWLFVACLIAHPLIGCGSSETVTGSSSGTATEGETTTTASGLIMTELQTGSGDQPKLTDIVVVHYHGTFEDGRVFDSSVDRGQPARFPLNGVVKCWQEGVQKMRVGGKARLVCPPGIAYGARGYPPTIPPNTTLNFEVELLEIHP